MTDWEVGPPVNDPQWRQLDGEPGLLDLGGTVHVLFSGHQGKGILAPRWRRRQGPDLDHLDDLPPAVLGASFDAAAAARTGFGGWWCCGLWIDPATGLWCTMVHCEYEYLYGTSWAHTCTLGVAVSANDGAHWEYLGDALTSAPSRRPSRGQEWLDFGNSDPRIHVDGGFVYVYYQEGWMHTGHFELGGLVTKVARAPLSGSSTDVRGWRKWVRGGWNEPGIGGFGNPLWSAPWGVGSATRFGGQPTVFRVLESDSVVAVANGWRAAVADPATQDWSPRDLSWPELGLWYSWVWDPERRSRWQVGSSFRFYSARTTNRAKFYRVTLARQKHQTPSFNRLENPSFRADLAGWVGTAGVCPDGARAMSDPFGALLPVGGAQLCQQVRANSTGTHRMTGWASVPLGARLFVELAGATQSRALEIPGVLFGNYYGHGPDGPPIRLDVDATAGDTLTVTLRHGGGDGAITVDDLALYRLQTAVVPTAGPRGPDAWWPLDDGAPDGIAPTAEVRDAVGVRNGQVEGSFEWVSGDHGALAFAGGRVEINFVENPLQVSTITWSATVSGPVLQLHTAAGLIEVSTPAPVEDWVRCALVLTGEARGLYVEGVRRSAAVESALVTGVTIGQGLFGAVRDVQLYAFGFSPQDIARDRNENRW